MLVIAYGSSVIAGATPCHLTRNVPFESLTCLSCNDGEVVPCGGCQIQKNDEDPGVSLYVSGSQGIRVSVPWPSLLPPSAEHSSMPPSDVLGFSLSMDVKVDEVSLRGNPVNSTLIVEFADNADTGVDQGYSSVFQVLAEIPGSVGGDWRTVTAVVEDPESPQLPSGWSGSGAFHPKTTKPQLAANRTFASVLLGANDVRFTTYVPGMVYSTDIVYRLRIDNVSWTFDAACDGGSVDSGARMANIGALAWVFVASLICVKFLTRRVAFVRAHRKERAERGTDQRSPYSM